MSAASDMVRWSLAWLNPHQTPPNGAPRVKAAMLVPAGTPCPPEILEKWVAGGPYCVSFEVVTQRPIRRWSQEAKARVRRRNLRARLEKKVPLFADIFEQEELKARPSYYAAADASGRIG